MKRIKDKWPVYLVNTLGLLILGYFLFITLTMFSFNTSTGISAADSASSHQGSVYFYEEDPDSVYKRSLEDLPYREYKRQADSINFIKIRYTLPFFTGFSGAPFGVGYCMECDTCTGTGYDYDYYGKASTRYYLSIPGFKLPPRTLDNWDLPVFYKKGGVSYKKFFRLDSIFDGKNKGRLLGHWINKPVRYRVQDDFNNKEEGKHVLIPISKTTYSVVNTLHWVIFIIYLLLYVLVARSFILVLIDIARGMVFGAKNYRHLFFMAYGIAFFPVYSLVVQVILQWSYRNWYAGDLYVYIEWKKNLGWLLAALVAFLLALAFRKGYRIQQEQALTI
jgi:hypothetical protein